LEASEPAWGSVRAKQPGASPEEAQALLVGSELQDRVAVERVVDRHDDRVGRAGLGDLLERDHVGDGVGAGAAPALRHRDAHEPQLTHALDRLVREARFAVDLRGDGAHVLLGELPRHRLDHRLLVGELQVHVGLRGLTPSSGLPGVISPGAA
jgi:hypothetical protein